MLKRNATAQSHSFAIVPGVQVPRSKFPIRQTRKMAFNASELIPIFCEEVLPGDTWQHTESIAARLATPIAPLVDDLDLETFYFFVPNRISWTNWEAFITGTNTALNVPRMVAQVPAVNYELKPNSVLDYFGLLPQVYTSDVFYFNRIPVMNYFHIYNDWFRDQNLQTAWIWDNTAPSIASNAITQNGNAWDQMPLRINKRSDYFTRSLPWPQKGNAVTLPLGTAAPLIPSHAGAGPTFRIAGAGSTVSLAGVSGTTPTTWSSAAGGTGDAQWSTAVNGSGLIADLANATAATINSIRLASTVQKLLERDARGGTRYIENILAHWGVRASNYMLQRPEYIGGGKYPIVVNPIAQTAAYDAEPTPTEASAIGNLGAEMHVSGHKRTFTFAAEEHGYIIGLCAVRATPTYQQGTRRHWLRLTRLDYWDPLFSELGEQDVKTQEIYQPLSGTPANATWGYQERGGEYRYIPNEITGNLRSTAAQPLDWWHLAEEFGSEPALNAAFITDKTQETLARSLATAPSEQWSAQIIMDINHGGVMARLMPAYSVPGISHF